MYRIAAIAIVVLGCSHPASDHDQVDAPGSPPVGDAAAPGDGGPVDAAEPSSSTLTAETAPNTSTSPLFADDYKNYNTTAQTGNSNGDALPHAISKVSIASAAKSVFVETQTWFCHLKANEAGARLVPNARCDSHIDVGYNADDPTHVAAAVADLASRGVTGVIMDWSGKDKAHDSDATYYPTSTSTDVTHARDSIEIGTNAIYAYRKAIEALPANTLAFAVSEDEGITRCRNAGVGKCSCWTPYSTDCSVTSQVISDLMYIKTHWTTSAAYLKIGGKPFVTFFAPDYNACPDKTKPAACQYIDWTAVNKFVGDQLWIFENSSGYAHAFAGGAFAWLSTTLYPGSDTSAGLNSVVSYDKFVKAADNVSASQHIVTSAFKGFDDGVTDGWKYADGSHTRYIEQRCGLTWLATLAQVAKDFPDGAELLQLPTWDDYEEATELETGIDTCLSSIDVTVSATAVSWTTSYGKDLIGKASGSEDTIDHFVVWASPDGEQLVRVAPDLARDASGELPHTLDLGAHPLPAGATKIFVQAVGKPFLTNTMSGATSIN